MTCRIYRYYQGKYTIALDTTVSLNENVQYIYIIKYFLVKRVVHSTRFFEQMMIYIFFITSSIP